MFSRSNLRPALRYWAVTVAAFYLQQLLVRDTGSAMFFLLILFPMLTFGCGLGYGLGHASLWYVLSVPLLFFPSGYLCYRWPVDTGSFYSLAYLCTAALGHALARCYKHFSKPSSD